MTELCIYLCVYICNIKLREKLIAVNIGPTLVFFRTMRINVP